jgi:hypothetical protein
MMMPIANELKNSFDQTLQDIDLIEENQNYFAMSLKAFFISMSTNHPDLLELMCHNFTQ